LAPSPLCGRGWTAGGRASCWGWGGNGVGWGARPPPPPGASFLRRQGRPLSAPHCCAPLPAPHLRHPRVLALKRVPFLSKVPPWAAPEVLEAAEARTLREVRVLAALGDSCPNIVRYHSAWLEADWPALARQLWRPAQEKGRRRGGGGSSEHRGRGRGGGGRGSRGRGGRGRVASAAAGQASSGAAAAPAAKRRERAAGAAGPTCIVTEITSGASGDDAATGGTASPQRAAGRAAGCARREALAPRGRPPCSPLVQELSLTGSKASGAGEAAGYGNDGSGSSSSASEGSGSSISRRSGSSTGRRQKNDSSSGSGSGHSSEGSSSNSESSRSSSRSGATSDDPFSSHNHTSHNSAFTFGDPSGTFGPTGRPCSSDGSGGCSGSSSGSGSSSLTGSQSGSSSGASGSGDGLSDGAISRRVRGTWAVVPHAAAQALARGPESGSSSGGSGGGGRALALRPGCGGAATAGAAGRQLAALPRAPSRWPYALLVTMELVEGPTLQEWLAARAAGGGGAGGGTPLPPPGAVELGIFRQIVSVGGWVVGGGG
jgi:hypothetical protein